MNGFQTDLSAEAQRNDDFRRVLYTTRHTQLVLMTIPPGGEIGAEIHEGIDQVLLATAGSGKALLDGTELPFGAGDVVVVPEGTRHNVVNDGFEPLRIATVYGPPDHSPGKVHHTKAEADADADDQPPQM